MSMKHTKQRIWLRDGKRCSYCGVPLTFKAATVDHVVPRCLGGTSCQANCRLACRSCNQRKANKPPHVWHAELCGVAA